MLGNLKQGCLTVAKSAGLFHLASSSPLRNARVLVLGYHGVALEDEHRWDPCLYLSPQTFRSRMEALKRNRCNVLSLADALRLSKAGQLPERAAVLTFDDGTYDFYKVAWPILKEFGYPATLYLTTYYVDFQYPVTPGIWRYMLWKTKASTVNAGGIVGKDVTFDLTTAAGRAGALWEITSFADSEKMEAEERNALSAKLAGTLGLEFDSLCERRLVQLLRPEEIRRIAQDGISVQMHMHYHSTPLVREAFIKNLEANRERIATITASEPTHFCYPSGHHRPEFVTWLRASGVQSATTCDLGLLSPSTDPLLIPRFIDTSTSSDVAFESWIVGVGALVSRVGALVPHA
ncbi:MAG: polysaccharide deacetylase family protein [Acidobacteriaceae bacterium]|nr:polysaccharide deacetylase family protein [Acidobacteriaceae bacterium]